MSTMSINPRTNIQDGRMEDTERRVNNQDILDEVQLVGELIYNGIMQDKTEQKTMEQVPHDPNLACVSRVQYVHNNNNYLAYTCACNTVPYNG